MSDRPEPVEAISRHADALETLSIELSLAVGRLLEMRHDGFRVQARQLEAVAEALDRIDRVRDEILAEITDLRRRWNDPDA